MILKKTAIRPHVLTASLVGLTLLPGIWTIATVPVSGLDSDVVSGAAQRHYETRFDDQFPMRDAIRQTWAAVKFGALGEVAEGAIVGLDGVLFTTEELTPPRLHRPFEDALQEASSRVVSAGAELIPIVVPDKVRMMQAALPRARSAHFVERYDQLLRIIDDAGLRTIDLRPLLSAQGSFMVTDTHWSPEGAKSVAAAIGDLLSNDLAGEMAFETTRSGIKSFDGDLLAFVDTGPWRSLVGPEPEQIATYETLSPGSDRLGLFGEIQTPVALVGTSFSAREDFHFRGFLKSALHVDVLSFAMEGQGPLTPMDRFLSGGALADAAPQIVLWEIPERYLDTWSQNQ